MDRPQIYAHLCQILERWRRLPEDELLAAVDAELDPVEISTPDGPLVVDLRVASQGRDQLRITAIGNGPSCWQLERLEESVAVRVKRPRSRDFDQS